MKRIGTIIFRILTEEHRPTNEKGKMELNGDHFRRCNLSCMSTPVVGRFIIHITKLEEFMSKMVRVWLACLWNTGRTSIVECNYDYKTYWHWKRCQGQMLERVYSNKFSSSFTLFCLSITASEQYCMEIVPQITTKWFNLTYITEVKRWKSQRNKVMTNWQRDWHLTNYKFEYNNHHPVLIYQPYNYRVHYHNALHQWLSARLQ